MSKYEDEILLKPRKLIEIQIKQALSIECNFKNYSNLLLWNTVSFLLIDAALRCLQKNPTLKQLPETPPTLTLILKLFHICFTELLKKVPFQK